MKKNELGVGLRVENRNGREGTVIATGGWVPFPGPANFSSTPYLYDGTEYRVLGRITERGAKGIVVAWDDQGGYASIESTRSLFPVGAYAAKMETIAIRVADEAQARRDAADALLQELVDMWGDEKAAAICARFHVEAGFPLSTYQREALQTAIAIGEAVR